MARLKKGFHRLVGKNINIVRIHTAHHSYADIPILLVRSFLHPPLVLILPSNKQVHEVRILPKLFNLLDLLRGIPSLDCESLQRLLLIRLP
ncbi:hypothetical protein D3C85_1481810 [compost metagenome]